jgi:hypothetical protein
MKTGLSPEAALCRRDVTLALCAKHTILVKGVSSEYLLSKN